jgi:hypothetical protein
MEDNYCLNCDATVDNKFCSSCGQKTNTHRIVLKHFLLHDLLHGALHLEKGIIFTLKETIVRPGQAALDYIKGKRVSYNNIFYLALLTVALNVLLLSLKEAAAPELVKATQIKKMDLNDFFSKYSKIALFCIVPILALNAKLIFKRIKLNLAEHFIVGGITLLGMLVLSTVYISFDILNQSIHFYHIIGFFEVLFFFTIPLFPLWAYKNLTKGLYKFWEFSGRILCFYLLSLIEMTILIIIISICFLNNTVAIAFSL